MLSYIVYYGILWYSMVYYGIMKIQAPQELNGCYLCPQRSKAVFATSVALSAASFILGAGRGAEERKGD